MALYRLETKIIGRAPTSNSPKGQSAVACAAYRAGDALMDEVTGEVIDYSRKKHGVLFSGIFVPKGAPDWMRDRQTLWNRVEQLETRIDARLAREYLLSLPHELTDQQRLQLVRDFVRENFTRHGLVADVAIHAPGKGGDERNYHAHIMVTLRQVEGDGFSKNKYRDMNSKAHLRQIRFAYARLCNRYLKNAGHNVRVDHRARKASQFVTAACQISGQRDHTAAAISGRQYHRRGNAKRTWQATMPLYAHKPAMLTKPLYSAPSYVQVPDVPSQMTGVGKFRPHPKASHNTGTDRRIKPMWVAVEKRQQKLKQ